MKCSYHTSCICCDDKLSCVFCPAFLHSISVWWQSLTVHLAECTGNLVEINFLNIAMLRRCNTAEANSEASGAPPQSLVLKQTCYSVAHPQERPAVSKREEHELY